MTEFTVHGKPIPEGSTKAYPVRRSDGSVGATITHAKSTELMEWRYRIAKGYGEAEGEMYGPDVPISIRMEFMMMRPKSVSAKKRPYPTARVGDIDKLGRAVADALTGVAYVDDSQIVQMDMVKLYSDGLFEGVRITIGRYEG